MESNNKDQKFNKPLIVYRIKSKEVFESTKKIIEYLIKNNYVEYIFLEKLTSMNSQTIFKSNKYEKYFKKFNKKTEDSNLCIIIGGDGTCLWANSLYGEKKKPPFLCFQGGNLGFLAIYELQNYESIFEELYKTKNYKFIHRKEIICSVYEKIQKKEEKNNYDDDSINIIDENEINSFEGYSKKPINVYNALNEVYLEKTANMSHLYLFLEDHFLAKVSSDGCIFATPTGSTAYSLSAGGPIVHNDVSGIIVTSICPFSLSFRPIVLPSNAKLRVKNNPKFQKSFSTIKMDGNNKGPLDDDHYIEISLSDSSIDFIVLEKTQESLNNLWIEKISKSLGWNYAFTH
jgi:NAD kinase